MRAFMVWLVCILSAAPAFAQGRAVTPEVIETVTIHRIFNESFSCGEHYDGELEYLGDALGTDCVIQGGLRDGVEGGFASPFRNDGARNEDWYGWNAEVLAPFDGTVVAVNVNPVVNQPGQLDRQPASIILFERVDGVRVLFAHVQGLQGRTRRYRARRPSRRARWQQRLWPQPAHPYRCLEGRSAASDPLGSALKRATYGIDRDFSQGSRHRDGHRIESTGSTSGRRTLVQPKSAHAERRLPAPIDHPAGEAQPEVCAGVGVWMKHVARDETVRDEEQQRARYCEPARAG